MGRAAMVLKTMRHRSRWLRHVFADGGYAGDKIRPALKGHGNWTIEIIKCSDKAKVSRTNVDLRSIEHQPHDPKLSATGRHTGKLEPYDQAPIGSAVRSARLRKPHNRIVESRSVGLRRSRA